MFVDAGLSTYKVKRDLWDRSPLRTLAAFLFSLRQEDAGLPGARKACQPSATAQPGQSSPSGETPGTKPASMSHSPPSCGARGDCAAVVGVAVGSGGREAVGGGGRVAVSVGGSGTGVPVGGDGGVSVGCGSVAVAGSRDGVGTRASLGAGIGVAVGSGETVRVRRAGAARVLVGVGVTPAAPGRHWAMNAMRTNKAGSASRTSKRRRFGILRSNSR